MARSETSHDGLSYAAYSLVDVIRAHVWDMPASRNLARSPGRAAGKIADWAASRAAKALERGARRPLNLKPTGAAGLTMDERRIVEACVRLRGSDAAQAQALLAFLAQPKAASAATRALSEAVAAMDNAGLQVQADFADQGAAEAA